MPSNLTCFFHLLPPQPRENFILRLFLLFGSVRIFQESLNGSSFHIHYQVQNPIVTIKSPTHFLCSLKLFLPFLLPTYP